MPCALFILNLRLYYFTPCHLKSVLRPWWADATHMMLLLHVEYQILSFYHRLFLPFGCRPLFFQICLSLLQCKFTYCRTLYGLHFCCMCKEAVVTARASNVCTLGGAGGGRMYECLANINIGLSRQPKSNTAAGHT